MPTRIDIRNAVSELRCVEYPNPTNVLLALRLPPPWWPDNGNEDIFPRASRGR